MVVEALTGKYVREPKLFKAGLGEKPENAEEAAILSAVAKGLGEVCGPVACLARHGWFAGAWCRPLSVTGNCGFECISNEERHRLLQDDISQFVLPTDQSGLQYIQDIHEQNGESALFVIGRAFDSEGPTYLVAYNKETGDENATVCGGTGQY